MLRDILRFNREAPALLDGRRPRSRSASYLARAPLLGRIHRPLPGADGRRHLVDRPARACSRSPRASSCASLHNHGMLSVDDAAAVARDPRRLGALRREARRAVPRSHPARHPVESVRRMPDGVLVKAAAPKRERFDHVFFACHCDQALRLLADATPLEREMLGAIPLPAKTRPCCIPTRRCCRVRGAPGPHGTITSCATTHRTRRPDLQHEHPAKPRTRARRSA